MILWLFSLKASNLLLAGIGGLIGNAGTAHGWLALSHQSAEDGALILHDLGREQRAGQLCGAACFMWLVQLCRLLGQQQLVPLGGE